MAPRKTYPSRIVAIEDGGALHKVLRIVTTKRRKLRARSAPSRADWGTLQARLALDMEFRVFDLEIPSANRETNRLGRFREIPSPALGQLEPTATGAPLPFLHLAWEGMDLPPTLRPARPTLSWA